MVLMVQKEVGQRICAKPPRMNLLAISVQFYAAPKIISYVSKTSFWPQPKVDAAVIKITPKAHSVGDDQMFFKIVRAGFSQPRKQLINNLSKKLELAKDRTRKWLLENGINFDQRAETLTVKSWISLARSYKIR
jgi:16S rRNA (adenine1518-N6/adenine1519-N6)-dimethyltransferase